MTNRSSQRVTSSNDTWEGPSSGTFGKLAVRVARHLTRRTALGAMVLAGAAAAAAAAVDPASRTGQVLLVLVGLLFSVVVLPDTPHRLWSVTARDLADTVPSPHLLSASRAIAGAIAQQAKGPVPENLVAQLWEESLSGLGVVIGEPSRIAIDLDYRIRVTPEGSAPPIIASSISSLRCVPGAKDGRVWFSFCSNLEALGGEFSDHANGCIQRELIDKWADETLDDWVVRISEYQVDLNIDGRPASRFANEVASGKNWRVVRVPFAAGDLAQRFVPIELTAEFHADPSQRRFPVKFSAYFVAGATQITFEVTDPDALVDCDEYISSATRNVTVVPTQSLRAVGYRLRASAGTVLPPGAGAVFSWENPPESVGAPTASKRPCATA